jgi:hypothetical protein
MDNVLALVFIGMALLFYFLPTVVAVTRDHPSAGGIAVINLFLGWTFLGWVCALAWSVSGRFERVTP